MIIKIVHKRQWQRHRPEVVPRIATKDIRSRYVLSMAESLAPVLRHNGCSNQTEGCDPRPETWVASNTCIPVCVKLPRSNSEDLRQKQWKGSEWHIFIVEPSLHYYFAINKGGSAILIKLFLPKYGSLAVHSVCALKLSQSTLASGVWKVKV